jgi:hypothetical protein
MSIDEKGSTSTLPRGEYSTTPARYTPTSVADTSAVPGVPTETVRFAAVTDRVTVSYNASEYATRRMIRKLNER